MAASSAPDPNQQYNRAAGGPGGSAGRPPRPGGSSSGRGTDQHAWNGGGINDGSSSLSLGGGGGDHRSFGGGGFGSSVVQSHSALGLWQKRLQAVDVVESDLQQVVLDYLIVAGDQNAAETFLKEAFDDDLYAAGMAEFARRNAGQLSRGSSGEGMDDTRCPTLVSSPLAPLRIRTEIRDLILAGEIRSAIEKINAAHPTLLPRHPETHFSLLQRILLSKIEGGPSAAGGAPGVPTVPSAQSSAGGVPPPTTGAPPPTNEERGNSVAGSSRGPGIANSSPPASAGKGGRGPASSRGPAPPNLASVGAETVETALAFAREELAPFTERYPRLRGRFEEIMTSLVFPEVAKRSVPSVVEVAEEVSKLLLLELGLSPAAKLDFLLRNLLWSQDQLESGRPHPRLVLGPAAGAENGLSGGVVGGSQAGGVGEAFLSGGELMSLVLKEKEV